MTVDAVYDAITIARLSVEAALAPLVLTKQGGTGAPRLYWRKPATGALALGPVVVQQSQDNGGENSSFLGIGAWESEWALRALANNDATAEEWLAAVRGGMHSLALPAGYSNYSIQAIYDRPLVLPPDQQVYQSAEVWLLRITRT